MGSWLSTKGPGEIWIGVAGPSGAGKTSLIQALLGDTNGGAPPDPNTGSKVVQYTHPRHPNVTFWEIPSEAVSRLESDPYDLIIIASPSENFGSEFAKFAVGGQAKGKACYFVRTKIDAYIQQYGSSISSVRELDQLLEDITSSCSNWLAEMGVQSSPIFLVSNARTDIYQFPQFCNTIEETIDELNRSRGQSSSSDPAEAPGWNLAILGDHWSGKSSLINALRGVRDGDTGAAQTGMEDSVTEPVMYPFPKYPKIRMWELPAISASTVPHQYLKQVSRDKYGTFIIIASEIFKEHHCRFAKALADMGKEVLFVRTKIDGDLQAFKQRHKPEYNERRSVEEIRQICVGCLEKGGVQDPDLFILTSFQTEKFGFRSLVSRFENHPDVIKCEIFERISKEEREDMGKAFESGGLPEVVSKISARLQSGEQLTVNIGVTGETGAGKSSLVNAIRGMADDQEGAAPTGVTETTMVPTSYPHPTFPNVKIWDLPGLGTGNFPLAKYREWVGFDRCDFFIIAASERFKENHGQLARWVQERGATFYFVRTKIDTDMEASQRAGKASQAVLAVMREDCVQCLEKQGMTSPQVFLVSTLKFTEYDFPQLRETLQRELPKFRKQALLRPLTVFCSQIIEKKRNSLSMEIWKTALVSSVVAATPIPGLGIACDFGILRRYLSSYYKSFGLDDESLERMSREIEKPMESLKAQIRSPNAKNFSIPLLYKLMSNSAGVVMMTGEYFIRGIPLFGSVASGGIGFATTHRMLNSILQNLAADTERVLKWVSDSKTE